MMSINDQTVVTVPSRVARSVASVADVTLSEPDGINEGIGTIVIVVGLSFCFLEC